VLTPIANLHALVANVIPSFIIVHVYLLTVGHGFRAHLRPMIRGLMTST
jgi:thiosulfate reductase cytochrome b subunit